MNTNVLYLEADKRDLVEKFFDKGQGYWFREDGQIDWNRRISPIAPWYYTKPQKNMDCHFWHHVLFDKIYNQKKVPPPCFECWKVVIMPRTVRELFTSLALQMELGIAGKVGIEGQRPNSNKLYGVYYYNKSLEEGQRIFASVKGHMDRNKGWNLSLFDRSVELEDLRFHEDGEIIPWSFGKLMIEGPPPIILKRGCTEFEQHCGPSNEWTFDADDVSDYEFYRQAFVKEHPNILSPDSINAHLFKLWLHASYMWGDPTYKEFTQGNELFTKLVTYQDMSIEDCDKIIKMRRRVPPRDPSKYPKGWNYKKGITPSQNQEDE